MPVRASAGCECRGAESIDERLVVRAANFFILGVDTLYYMQYNVDRKRKEKPKGKEVHHESRSY